MIDHTPAGPQYVIPGAERVGDGTLAQRRADAPLRPTAPQKPPGGMFGDAPAQIDLIDVLRVRGPA
jgi:hypothetical protein